MRRGRPQGSPISIGTTSVIPPPRYLAMSGVSLVEIAKVLGHRTLAMVARYSHLSDGHIVATGEKLAARLGIGK